MGLLDLAAEEFKIGEALKSIVQVLQLTTLLPAIWFVILTAFFFFPSPSELSGITVGLLVFAVITISFLLHALNMPIIRLWEGYIFGDTRLAQALKKRQLDRFDQLRSTVEDYNRCIREIEEIRERLQLDRQMDGTKKRELERWLQGWKDHRQEPLERLATRFPPTKQLMLPTSLGNTIAAFEMYPYERYSIDTSQLWTRLVPLLTANKFSAFVRNEKAILDFLINLLSVNLLILVEGLTDFGLSGDMVAIGVLVGVASTSWVLYKAAVVAATNWGETVKVAFDLYRHDLRCALRLRLLVPSLKGERAMWKGISDFFAFNNATDLTGFDYTLDEGSVVKNEACSSRDSAKEGNHATDH